MDVEHHVGSVGQGAPDVVDGEVEQEVGIGLAGGQEGLAALDVLEERGGVLPHSTGRGHVDRRVEHPSGEFGSGGRIGRTVEIYVVDSGRERLVKLGLALAQRGAEMLRKPGQRLAGSVFLAAYVRCRRGELEHRHVTVVGADYGILPQSGDVEGGAAEGLAFGNVHLCIDVEQVGGRAVRLVAHAGAVRVAPLNPGVDEILHEHVAQAFAVVHDGSVVVAELGRLWLHGHGVPAGRLLRFLHQVGHYVVAVLLPEVFREAGSPVGSVHLVRVVEPGVGPVGSALFESLVETLKIGLEGFGVVVVHDPALASGGGSLDFLPGLDGLYSVSRDLHLLGRNIGADLRAAERPARAVVHVAFQPEPLGLRHQILVHLHPFGGEVVYVIGLVALHAVDRGDFVASDARLGELFEVPCDTLLVNGAAQPPPADERLVFGDRRVPSGVLGGQAEGRTQPENG